jgi:hypothetical protein
MHKTQEEKQEVINQLDTFSEQSNERFNSQIEDLNERIK